MVDTCFSFCVPFEYCSLITVTGMSVIGMVRGIKTVTIGLFYRVPGYFATTDRYTQRDKEREKVGLGNRKRERGGGEREGRERERERERESLSSVCVCVCVLRE